MVTKISNAVRNMAALVAAVLIMGLAGANTAQAQSVLLAPIDKNVTNERYAPTVWIDPDGCEHWVMDDGFEGYMTPHVTRQGIPVCRRGNVCGVLNSDQYFATNSYKLSRNGVAQLKNFFRQSGARAYIVAGHTDSRASDEYNMKLSYNRANTVAGVAQSIGAKIVDVRGYGERMPAAPNNSASGMAKNRRVEIICIR